MGATTIISTDKTGTLTHNQMQVHKTSFFGLNGKDLDNNELSNLIKESVSVNSTADLDFTDPGKIRGLGNPTEAALLLWLNDRDQNYLAFRQNVDLIEQLTFSTERKYMATLVYSPLLNKKILYVKGAPEIVLSKCENVLFEDGLRSANGSAKTIEDLLNQYQNQALRTLGFAYEVIEDEVDRFCNGNLVNTNLTYLGIVAISDPLREDVPDAVKKCLNAGIEVKMITGDTIGTAKEIGRQIGVWNNELSENNLIFGSAFESRIRLLMVKYKIWISEEATIQQFYIREDKKKGIIERDYFTELMDVIDVNEDLFKELPNIKIMCRAKPIHKQHLVQMLQKIGSIVAVTGDGTNDAPALKHAHVGLSMGSGTMVAKEASDITLIDDSFSSITNAVLWGRSIFRNIQRFIVFQLTINVAALIIDFIGAIFWGKLPLTVTQLLWINLIMDTFAAGALASLPPDPKVMKEKPRDRNAFIVNKEMRNSIFGVGLLFVVLLLGLLYYFTKTDYFGTNEKGLCNKELTIFFTFFVFLQFWNMFNAKAFFSGKSAFHSLFKSYGFLIVACVIFTGQILIVELGGDVFRTVPITISEWLIIISSTSVVLWIGELVRFINRRNQEKVILVTS
jgi:Ca2+-transporting ATPase